MEVGHDIVQTFSCVVMLINYTGWHGFSCMVRYTVQLIYFEVNNVAIFRL